MPLQATSGAASYDAFGGGVPVVPAYIEEVFATWLYSGTGSAQTITNGIDLSGKGGLVWIKNRSATSNHVLGDTARNANYSLASNLADAETYNVGGIFSSFNSNGFSIGTSSVVNASGNNFTSWSFRKSNKFYTQTLVYHSNGTPSTVDLSSLGTVGAVLVKSTNVSGDWYTWHRSLTAGNNIRLNTTAAESTTNAYLSVSGTTLTISSAAPDDFPYVVYAFAHNAGGFGLTGTDNVISCGSYTGNGAAGNSINLGYEPQWILIKRADSATGGAWMLQDNMRGFTAIGSSGDAQLNPNTSSAETAGIELFAPTATGFTTKSSGYNISSGTYIYIAIRRGPMKVPTSGTSVFSPIAYVGANGAAQNISAGFPVDMDILKIRNDASRNPLNHARLMGGVFLSTNATGAQQSYSDNIVSFNNAQNVIGLPVTGGGTNEINGASTSTYIGWAMRRAPSFMDVVCYTGNGVSGRDISHNLSASPEMVIIKARSRVDDWVVRSSAFPTHGVNGIAYLNYTIAASDAGYSYVPTSTTFQVEANQNQNGSGNTYVAYLFATCAGVSKVGSYTGNGTTQTIDCGFTGGARFVLIKRTDSTSGWYVYDTARGMTVLTDPYLFLNNTDAESATLGSVTTVSTGFALNSSILAAINVSGGTYIFFAVA